LEDTFDFGRIVLADKESLTGVQRLFLDLPLCLARDTPLN
jgi:hypothetical protein